MPLPELSFIDEARALEIEAVEGGRGTSEFAFAPQSSNFDVVVGEGNDEALHGRPVDDIMELRERLEGLPRYVELARRAFEQRGLTYPFAIDDSRSSLGIIPGRRVEALQVARLSAMSRQGNPVASQFEKRAFRALHQWVAGWATCIGAPREEQGLGAEKTIRLFRHHLLPTERDDCWPEDFHRNGDHGADGFIILGRGWGGPVIFYQSKNTGFDLEAYPEEFARIPGITEDWFGRKLTEGRRIIPVLALNTILTIELKERIFAERGQDHGTHILDAVDILAAETVPPTDRTRRSDCLVF